ncbi:MAG: hypothetical protein ACE5I4_00465 [Thermoplasmata archaeon]
MQAKSLFRILRSVGWVFGAGAGLFMAALVLVVSDGGLWLLSLVLVVGGALLWAAFATAALTLLVELAEGPQRRAATRE